MPKEYKCTDSFCGEILWSSKGRRRHVHKEHGPLSDVCSQCNEPFLATKSLEQHLGNFDHSKDRSLKPRRRKKRKAKMGTTGVAGGIFQHMLNRNSMPSTASSQYHQTPTMPYSSDVYTVNSGNIDSFISRYAQPDQSYLNTCGAAADLLVNFLQHNAPGDFRPRRVIKGGSLCKGTALKGKSDLDIAVMLSQYTDVRTMHKNMNNLLGDLERCLKTYPNVIVRGRTHRCLEIDIKLPRSETLSADVLPAVDVLEIESRRADIYEKMRGCDKDIEGFYSPCLAPLQKELFADLPTKLKSLIRLVKYWKKDTLMTINHSVKWPTSYVMELVVLNAWREAGQPVSFDMTRLLHAVLKSLVNHKDFRVIFEGQMFYDRRFVDYVRHNPPYIMDPCNPCNNVYSRGNFAWDKTANEAKEWLKKPLFQGI